MFAASKTDGAVALAQADPFFDNVSLLLNTSGTNGAQNNTFIDSSTNNFTITRNGNTTQGSFSPYGENWSNYFDGTGDYLSLATNAAFGFGTGAFTIECWFNTQAIPASGADYLFDMRTTFSQAALLAYISPSAGLEVAVNGAAVITGGTVVVNTWNHFALAKSGTTTRMFLNGVQVGSSYTDNVNYVSTAPVVIASRFTAEDFYQGYISNFRVIKGTALYTANFTPSTVPLQPVAGTSLLTCKDPNIVDDSANQFTITRNGDVSVQKFGPFSGVAPTTPYFSGYFDGNGDYFTLPSNQAQFSMGTGDFTIEMWINLASLASERTLYDTLNQSNTSGTGRFAIRIQTSGTINLFTGSGQEITSGGTLVVGTWYHIAYARQASSGRLYVNGVQVNTTNTDTRNYVVGTSNRPIIGVNGFDNSTGPMFGYISNFRLVKGQALYTSNFTPSTSPLTTTSQGAIASNVSLLTCQSSTFVDNSPNNFTLTIAGNTRPTAFAPFAITYTSLQPYTPAVFGGSMYFDGNGDALSIPASSALLGAGNFTVEFWVNVPVTLAAGAFYTCFAYGSTGSVLRCFIYESLGVKLGIWIGSTINPINVSFVPFIGTWTHVAITRVGTTLTLYVNGVSSGTYGSDSTNYNAGQLFVASQAGGIFYAGYISDFRVIVGTARYTSNFVPQNTPLTAVTNTALLLNATNAGIYDAATLNDFETVGNAQVSTSVTKYGTSSVAFDNDGDRLVIPYNRFLSQTGRYTVEFWFYPNYNFSGQYIFARNAGNYFCLNWNGSTTRMNVDQQAIGIRINGSISMPLNQWHYFAMTYDGTTTRTFANGVLDGSFNGTGGEASGPTTIGFYDAVGTSSFGGYISDFRFTLGVARYTTNFTPPTAALPTF